MKKRTCITVIAATLLSGATALQSADASPSAAYGKQLFDGNTLGGPGGSGSCVTCHPGGKGLEKAWMNPDLERTINTCIAGPLKGKPLPVGSVELQSLRLYIESLKPAGR